MKYQQKWWGVTLFTRLCTVRVSIHQLVIPIQSNVSINDCDYVGNWRRVTVITAAVCACMSEGFS